MILQLKKGYLDARRFQEKFGIDILDHWAEVWAGHEQDELCRIDRTSGRIELTRDGLLQVDSMLPAFFEPEHQGIRYT
jgi:oxygen-independent coproporphyrinogen-3 oxidase